MALVLSSAMFSFAQKKLVSVSVSELTGITLPEGSLQDKRMLSVSAANMLLGMESKKTNRSTTKTEVFLLPAASSTGIDQEVLIQKLSVLGWKVSVNDDKQYAWLQKGNQDILMYFSTISKESNLYFSKASGIAVRSSEENRNNTQLTQAGEPQIQNTVNTSVKTAQIEPVEPAYQQVSNISFAFTTTNFNDGWTSTVQDDWVQVTKGNIKVLIHYPNKQADAYNSVLMDGLKNAWNVLVAPKYSSASNFEFKPLTNWEAIEFAEADMVEKSSGRQVHVVLFKKNYNSGGGKYLEFITPDKTAFEQEFGAYHEGSSGWEKIENMASYNKFAVAASDLSGKWTSDFSGAIQYVNASTGFDAGMDTHASKENFQFGPGNNYQWDLGVASGAVGNIKFQSVKSSGNFSMVNNWQVRLSDIEGKPITFNTYFSCIKGLRILWLDTKSYAKVE